ncbi:MAG: galactose oxidase [Leeuwenhoekiella sp.]
MNYKRKFIIGIGVLALTVVSCSSDDDTERGNWQERSVFDGIPRSNVAGFTIGNYGYMGTGYDGDDYLTDFWQYDIEGDYWVQKADFPGTARSSATSFTADGMGYVGIGYDGENELSDFWQYNPNSNSWVQKQDFGGGARRAAIGFGTTGAGYIGTGYDGDNDKKDFWKYDTAADTWTEIVGFGGDKRRDATSFEINGLVYVGTGVSNGLYKTDFWSFDPSTEAWTKLNDLDEEDDYSIVRSNAVSFGLNGLGYIVAGYSGGTVASTWEYDPLADDWENITSLEATARQDAISFSTAARAFVLLGRSGSLYLDDAYEIFPQEDYDDED